MIPRLKYLHSFSAGVDHLVNHPIFRDTNIRRSTSSGIHGPPIAEWVVMNWLVYSRMYTKILEAKNQQRWLTFKEVRQWEVDDHVGQTVGILGYGSIGRQGKTYIGTNNVFSATATNCISFSNLGTNVV